jgi:hypothetical protein
MRHLTWKTMFLFLLCCLGTSIQAQTTNVDITITPSSFPYEISWELLDGSAAVVDSRACGFYGASEVINLDLNDGETYTFNAFDDWGDGWNGGTWSITKTSDGCVLGSGVANNFLAGDGTDICDASQLEESFSFDPAGAILGCTDPAAGNYNPCATVDDGSCILAAANDACANAISVPRGTCYTGSNVDATAGGSPVSPTCVDGLAAPADIWFTTTVPANGAIIIEFPSVPGFTSIVELYQGGNCGALPPGILASRGFCLNYAAGGALSVDSLAPGPLLIRYWDFGSDDEGALELCIQNVVLGCTDPCSPAYNPAATVDDGSCTPAPAPANDLCSAAQPISAGTIVTGNAGASGTDISSCTSSDSLDVWYAYNVPVGLDSLWIYTCDSDFDTGLSLWDKCPSDTTAVEIACNDDGIRPGVGIGISECGGSIFQSAIGLGDSILSILGGSTIYVRLAGFDGQSGCAANLTVEEIGAPSCVPIPPTNQTHTNLSNRVQLNWTPTPLAVACNVQGKRLPTGPTPSVDVLTAPYNTTNVPYAVAGAGTTWTWRVRCACSISPVVASPFTAYGDTFSIPVAREGDMLNAEDMIFPNPADNDLFVAYNATEDASNVSFTIVDMLGRVVANQTMDVTAGIMSVRFDVSGMEEGNYFVQIVNGEEMTTTQFSVTH